MNDNCPQLHSLHNYVNGIAIDLPAHCVETHLRSCMFCRTIVETIEHVDDQIIEMLRRIAVSRENRNDFQNPKFEEAILNGVRFWRCSDTEAAN